MSRAVAVTTSVLLPGPLLASAGLRALLGMDCAHAVLLHVITFLMALLYATHRPPKRAQTSAQPLRVSSASARSRAVRSAWAAFDKWVEGRRHPLCSWKVPHRLQAPSHTAISRSHPLHPHLHAITVHLPLVPLKSLYDALIDVASRPQWDGLCNHARLIKKINRSSKHSPWVSHLQLKAYWPKKPVDLVFLSVPGTVTPISSLDFCRNSRHAIAIASSSVVHPAAPPSPDYQRVELASCGFWLQDDGKNGSVITRYSDLSGLGSLPSFAMRAITARFLPDSLRKLGARAQELNSASESKSSVPEENWDWMPPQFVHLSQDGSENDSQQEEEDDGDADDNDKSDDQSKDREIAVCTPDKQHTSSRSNSNLSAAVISHLIIEMKNLMGRLSHALPSFTTNSAKPQRGDEIHREVKDDTNTKIAKDCDSGISTWSLLAGILGAGTAVTLAQLAWEKKRKTAIPR